MRNYTRYAVKEISVWGLQCSILFLNIQKIILTAATAEIQDVASKLWYDDRENVNIVSINMNDQKENSIIVCNGVPLKVVWKPLPVILLKF